MKQSSIIKSIISVLCVFILILSLINNTVTSVNATQDDSVSYTEKNKRKQFMSEVLSDFPDKPGKQTFIFTPSNAIGNFKTDNNNAVNFDDGNVAEWKISVADSGLFYLEFDYELGSNNGNKAAFCIKIDGEVPYFESENVKLYRYYEDVKSNKKVNNKGDQIRPNVEEIKGKHTCDVRDSGGYYSTPLLFYFSEGEHSVAIEQISQSFCLFEARLLPYEKPISYEQLSCKYPKNIISDGEIIVVQAEDSVISKNDATVRVECDGDPATKPISYGYRVFNCVGGYGWRSGNQSIKFEFTVPKSGYYQIAFRALQAWNDGIPSYRCVKLDGRVPCSELLQCRFDYDSEWQTVILKGKNESPFFFYFDSGKTHTIEMTVVLGELTEIVNKLYDAMQLLSDMLLNITLLTGNNPDPNYDYRFYKFLPNLEGQFTQLIDYMIENKEKIFTLSGRNTGMGSNFKSIIKQFQSMRDDPFTIAKRYSQLSQAQESMASWYLECQKSPLLIDEIVIATEKVDIKHRSASIFAKIMSTFKNFTSSFIKDYNGIGNTRGNGVVITDEITVWVAKGTEWVEAIQELTDANYTSKTGVAVNMRVVPASQLNTGSANVLLLSLISGKAPDVALGVSTNSPIEFAMRGAVEDLTQFKDYNEVCNFFPKDMLIPFSYIGGGKYALPETLNFSCLFYRSDVLDKYCIKVPNTRDELYYTTLPALYQNGLQYYQTHDYMQFLYQNGGKLYNDDGKTCALDEAIAVSSFKEYTEMFTNYACEVSANFFNRFRSGEMPLGVGGYGMYLQLTTAAPELMGKWGIAPMIGVESDDGSVDRTMVGFTGSCGMILKSISEKVRKNSWEFLKWWMSTKTQKTFSSEIESLIGVEGRWNSANIEAFLSLEWEKDDIFVIKEMLNWMTDNPVVPGSYYTGTYINNAFTNVVISENSSPRDALEEIVVNINRELEDKQKEYGLYE